MKLAVANAKARRAQESSMLEKKPEKFGQTSFLDKLKDISQILN